MAFNLIEGFVKEKKKKFKRSVNVVLSAMGFVIFKVSHTKKIVLLCADGI
jgi:hypothetical protein